ncbi:MAG TPA: hypothetical protein DEE98_01130 [Elusimicrobia bacterium]|nr:MAG: hypothetical protein A2278_03835 [Elusimicrobia bacterium RIFOXYA12_FULL_49_49]OGS10064.1 MAG: hypothetical protein A2204_07850 [Elusimicrobia bacterium RIFOXYA1_FULL_47_7]OGS15293.1 MAG: hypothetical protein A2251_07150 [Elusimicrobia bacterium RIFOXYA2_FULL_47_53]OGS26553.1 MAG: hypothetical protein A2339_06970 [Elusimicrobia bacterium RIFOXYB12_FULL_50_12]OGS30548.1 MAG: hypothetical protein A2323_02270 [Elusimicrobia bacterium RIFOXYB2_FULL_46_23]HBU68968.1 hypothetical protein [El
MSEFSKQIRKDALTDFALNSAEWIKANRTLFLSIAGSAAGIIIFVIFFFTRFYTLNARAGEKLAFGQSLLYQGQAEQGDKLISEVINQYQRTPSSVQARLIKSEYLSSQKKFEEAEQILLPVAEREKPKELMPMVISALGSAQEDAGKYQQAIATYNSFIARFPDNFIAPKIIESLARVYELTNSPDEARASYEKIASLYPATQWAVRAQERLIILSKSAGSSDK